MRTIFINRHHLMLWMMTYRHRRWIEHNEHKFIFVKHKKNLLLISSLSILHPPVNRINYLNLFQSVSKHSIDDRRQWIQKRKKNYAEKMLLLLLRLMCNLSCFFLALVVLKGLSMTHILCVCVFIVLLDDLIISYGQ